MKTTEIVGFRREDVGTKSSKLLRADGNVPCVLYGGDEIIHFHSPMILFKDLFYTNDAFIVNLNIEGTLKRAILKDSQFHPVSDVPLHADFLEIFDDKEVEVLVPIKVTGNSPGVIKGGQLQLKTEKLRVKAKPALIPDYVSVNISSLDLGKSLKVKHIEAGDYAILNNENVSVATVIIPRALKAAQSAGEE